MSNNEFNFTPMKILNIHSHYKVNISNDKADINEKIVFLNSNLQYITGGASCLTRYLIIVVYQKPAT